MNSLIYCFGFSQFLWPKLRVLHDEGKERRSTADRGTAEGLRQGADGLPAPSDRPKPIIRGLPQRRFFSTYQGPQTRGKRQ